MGLLRETGLFSHLPAEDRSDTEKHKENSNCATYKAVQKQFFHKTALCFKMCFLKQTCFVLPQAEHGEGFGFLNLGHGHQQAE